MVYAQTVMGTAQVSETSILPEQELEQLVYYYYSPE